MEPLDDALRRLRRRADLASVAILGVIVGIITPLWIAEPPPMTWYAAANLSIFFFLPPAILFVLGRWGLRRMRSQYARIRPAIRDVGIGFLRGVVIVLHNGLFVQSIAPAHIASLFFTSGGARMQPTVADALRWTGPMRWKRETTILGWRRSAASAGLEAVRTTSGAALVNASVGRYSSRAFEPSPPGWMATVTLGRTLLTPPPIERLVAASEVIAGFLEGLVWDQLAQAGAS